MLPFPDTDFDPEEPEAIADWVELSALAEGGLRLNEVRDELARALPETASGRFRARVRRGASLNPFDGLSEILFENVRPTLTRRKLEMRSGYPFTIDRTTISVKDSGWPSYVVYTSLAMADLGRRYSRFKQGLKFRILFERIVTGSLRARLMGATVRFGSPRENRGVPGSVGRRIVWLSESMDVSVNEANRVTKRSTGDEGLDVASRLSFGDNLPGNVVVLVQCSTSSDIEKAKKGEPAIAKWQAFLNWDSLLVKAVATPYRLDPPRAQRAGQLCKAFEYALILDRPRLCHGRVDKELDPSTLGELSKWCRRGFATLARTAS